MHNNIFKIIALADAAALSRPIGERQIVKNWIYFAMRGDTPIAQQAARKQLEKYVGQAKRFQQVA